MRKFFVSALLVLSALSLNGCFIDMAATTKINDDGSGFRITTYTADGASEKEELFKNYILPPGGEWTLNQYVKDSAPEHIYEAKQAFTDLNKLPPDYSRKGAIPGDVSSNKFSLKVNKGILFTTYEYEETYKDCIDGGKIRKFCSSWYDHAVGTAAAEVARAFPKAVKEDKARSMLDARFRPYFEYFVSGFISEGRKFLDDKNNQFKAKNAEFEKKYSAEDLSVFFTDYIISVDSTADKKAITEKMMAVHASIDKQLSDYSTALSGRNYDDAFGVYGMPVLMGYSFEVSVAMPGRITECNGSKVRSNVAKWEFTEDDFFLNEFKLRVKSHKLNLAGIGAAAVILAVILLAMYKRERKDK